jgi:ABC-type lipoprotein release transport system permease subunit
VYHPLLLRRYLTTKILPLLAAAAVMLCTATVLIVWSVMGGFLAMLLQSGRTLVGDVIISWPVVGMGYYSDLVEELEREPLVEAATPMIETAGTLVLPDQRVEHVFIKGVDGPSYARVTGYGDALWWRPLERPLPKDKEGGDIRVTDSARILGELPERLAEIKTDLERVLDSVSGRTPIDPAGAAGASSRLKELIASFPQVSQRAREALAAPEGTQERIEKSAEALGLAEELGEELGVQVTTLEGTGAAGQAPANTGGSSSGEASAGGSNLLPDNRLFRFRLDVSQSLRTLLTWQAVYANGLALSCPDQETRQPIPAMTLGMEVTNFNQRRPEGYYSPAAQVFIREEDGNLRPIDARVIGRALTLNVLPLDSRGRSIAVVSRALPVANEFKTGIFDIDRRTVLVRLDALQQMLKMDEARIVEPARAGSGGIYDLDDGPDNAPPQTSEAKIAPARVTTVLVRGRAGAPLEEVRRACINAYGQFALAHAGHVPDPGSIRITTWEQEQAMLIAAVKNEIVMMLIILGIISLTVSFLILAIFWAIVSEKTKDIGILRAIGASRGGVAGIWLGYGLAIGIIGSTLGCLAACLIVWNINPIHDWLGRALGIVVWNPAVYYFSEIPNDVETEKALLVFVAGICFSVLGALLPAVKAARMDPVRALRFE